MQTNETSTELLKKQQAEKIRLLEERVIAAGKIAEERLARPREEWSFKFMDRKPMTSRQKYLFALSCLGLACLLYGFNLSDNFIFAGEHFYATTLPWVVAVVVFPFVLYGCYDRTHQANIADRYPSPVLRQLVFIPLMACVLTFIILRSPIVLSALAGWAFNSEVIVVEATVSSLGRLKPKLGMCDQTLRVGAPEFAATICMEQPSLAASLFLVTGLWSKGVALYSAFI
ncbi:hypothetical protein ACO0LG_17065 [Undibacterium sp. Ji42W]|uniref:hypothetical protein n=1 Tax=Undibacterium sp. Ji42W TaxID=3413039 RepID=UPI003BF0396D